MVFLAGRPTQPVNSLDAYENDICLQLDFLKSFQRQAPVPAARQRGVIFAGSGDSLAASMLAESFSGGLARAADPLDLYQNRSLLREKTVYFVSVSGNTASNVRSARAAPRSVAVTADPGSRLARSCGRAIRLRFPSSGVFTAGSIGFLSSALTCISLVCGFGLPRAGRPIFERATDAARGTRAPKGRIYLLGNYHTYPVAMYCAAKFYEVLGADARYCRMEQFSHMELFSVQKNDTVIIFDEPTAYGRRLAGRLRSAGLDVHMPCLRSRSMISKMLYFVFYSQLLPLRIARDAGRADCHFVLAKKIRDVSNDMIY